jgi:hypothetical protein
MRAIGRTIGEFVNKLAQLGVDPDRLERVTQQEMANSMALWAQKTAQVQQAIGAAESKIREIEPDRVEREQQLQIMLQRHQLGDHCPLFIHQLERQSQIAELAARIVTHREMLQAVQAANAALKALNGAFKADPSVRDSAQQVEKIGAAQWEMESQHLTLRQQHVTTAQTLNTLLQNAADPSLPSLLQQCCTDRDRLGKLQAAIPITPRQ